MPGPASSDARSRPSAAITTIVSLGRRSWRQLTSMRTALVLLFLLAVAAVPGSLLPQRRVNVEKVRAYLADNPRLGPWLDRMYGFDVYASPWFSAIYLLLMVSLIGCLVPRLRSHVTALVRRPPDAPARLTRLPAYAEIPPSTAGDAPAAGGADVAGGASVAGGADVAGGVSAAGGAGAAEDAAVARGLRVLLRRRRFRVAVRAGERGVTVSGEKGYLKETGNLLFHFAVLALLIGVAFGSRYGWHANRLLVAGQDGAFCNSLQQYDEYGLGAGISGADLPPFCLRLDNFHADYLDNGQPTAFDASIAYWTAGSGRGDSPERTRRVSVNAPLRLDGTNVYLLGHGYASVLKYTDVRGRTQTVTAPLLPRDSMLTSEGVALFPDAASPDPNPTSQIGFTVLYLPTVPSSPTDGRSAHPAERNPRLMLQAYRGNLGLDAGTPLSVYELDRRQLATGRLVKYDKPHALRVGESWTLADGSTVEFLGTKPWVSLSVRHDPGESTVLAGAVVLLIGLIGSLTGRRRRVWFRVRDGRVTAGGLPRSDYPGFQAEFDAIVAAAREALDRPPDPPAGARGVAPASPVGSGSALDVSPAGSGGTPGASPLALDGASVPGGSVAEVTPPGEGGAGHIR